MQKIASQISLLIFVGLITPLVTSCGVNKGASKVVQCRSMIKIIREAEDVSGDFYESAKSIKDTNKLTQLFADTSAKMIELNKDMQGLEIQDAKLKDSQSRMAKIYLEYGRSLDIIASTSKSKNKALYDKSNANIQALNI